MRILVTGGAGYIGSILCGELLGLGHRVTVLDNFMFRQSSLNAYFVDSFFDVVRGDARDPTTMERLLKKADVLIPLAALVGAPICAADVIGATTTNYGAIVEAISLMSRDQIIIAPISNSGYGVGEPGKECTEETPMRPVSVYGLTKVDAEKAILDRGNAISLRLATVFGMSPRMRTDLLVNDFVLRALTDRAVVLFEPHFKRNYVHVRDVAGAFVHCLHWFDGIRDEAYNVGLSSANLSKLELCERIKRHVPEFTFPIAPIGEDPDKRDYVVSNAKFEATGWKPEHTLDEGIAELIRGYQGIRNAVHGNL